MLVESLVNPQMFGMGGEGVMILKPSSKSPIVLNGNTVSPSNFNFLNLVTKGNREIPDEGILTAGVPSAFLLSSDYFNTMETRFSNNRQICKILC